MELVYLEWRDSCHRIGWSDTPIEPSIIKTIAWLVEESETHIVVSAHNDGEGMTHSPMAIPMESIVTRYEVVFK